MLEGQRARMRKNIYPHVVVGNRCYAGQLEASLGIRLCDNVRVLIVCKASHTSFSSMTCCLLVLDPSSVARSTTSSTSSSMRRISTTESLSFSRFWVRHILSAITVTDILTPLILYVRYLKHVMKDDKLFIFTFCHNMLIDMLMA